MLYLCYYNTKYWTVYEYLHKQLFLLSVADEVDTDEDTDDDDDDDEDSEETSLTEVVSHHVSVLT